MKKLTTIIAFTAIFLISVAISYILNIYSKISVKTAGYISQNQPTPLPTPTPDPLAPKNILLLGYAGPGHDGANLTDTIIVAHVIPKENKIILISIPRDIWIPLPISETETQYNKINAAYAIGLDNRKYPYKPAPFTGEGGGGSLAKYAVEYVTGLSINNFTAVNFDGFKNIINTLGGIKVNIPYSFEDKYFPLKGMEEDNCGKTDEELEAIHATMSGYLLEQQFTCRYEVLTFTKGIQTMDADTALKFVRSRHSETNGNDFERSLRQRALITAIKDHVLKLKTVTKIIPLINNISKNVSTDINLNEAIDLFSEYSDINDIKIYSSALSIDNVLKEDVSEDRQYILAPKNDTDNFQEIKDFINEELLRY